MLGSNPRRHGPLPKLQLPGDDTLISPCTREAAAIITESLARPELAPHLYRRDTLSAGWSDGVME